MSIKKTLLIICDSPGCQASAQIELDDVAEANALVKANKWLVVVPVRDDFPITHTCPWCAEQQVKS